MAQLILHAEYSGAWTWETDGNGTMPSPPDALSRLQSLGRSHSHAGLDDKCREKQSGPPPIQGRAARCNSILRGDYWTLISAKRMP